MAVFFRRISRSQNWGRSTVRLAGTRGFPNKSYHQCFCKRKSHKLGMPAVEQREKTLLSKPGPTSQ